MSNNLTGSQKTYKVVSVSLGSSYGDFSTTAVYLGHSFEISRIGTDGDLKAFADRLRSLDGNVDAIGLGGMDMNLYAGGKRYGFRDCIRLAGNAKITPVVDGSGLKNTLEREVMRQLRDQQIVDFGHTKTLVVCAVDRFGMAEAVAEEGGPVVFGDLMFNLGLPIAIRSFAQVKLLASLILPIITRLPFQWVYPTGEKQNTITPKFGKYYDWADTIVGDGHLIRRFMPAGSDALFGKTIITNTTTPSFREELRGRGLHRLVTTTPSFEGRSPGTNVMEGVLVAATGKRPDELMSQDYQKMIDDLGWKPEVTEF